MITTIVFSRDIAYWLTESVDQGAQRLGISFGEIIFDDAAAREYQPDPNLYFCHAVKKYHDKWFLENSLYSAEGTIDLQLVEKVIQIEYQPFLLSNLGGTIPCPSIGGSLLRTEEEDNSYQKKKVYYFFIFFFLFFFGFFLKPRRRPLRRPKRTLRRPKRSLRWPKRPLRLTRHPVPVHRGLLRELSSVTQYGTGSLRVPM